LKIFKREKRRMGKMRNLKKVFVITFLFILLGLVFVKLTGKWIHIEKEIGGGFAIEIRKL
jgi:hypothetical protein